LVILKRNKKRMVRKNNVLAIMSPKGGVGKTMTTANLAVALANEFDKKVLAIDTNISTASLGLHMDIWYPKLTIYDILEKKYPMAKIIHTYSDNLHVIPASIRIRKKDKNPNNVRENVKKIVKNYERLLNNLSKEYDLILLDCAPGFDIESIATMHVAGGLLLVTNPEYPAIVTAVKALEYAKNLKVPVGGIILNKVGKKKYELKKKEIEEALKAEVIAEIPFDKRVPESIANRMPVVIFKPNSKSAVAYKKLAGKIVGEEYKHDLKKVIKGFFRH